MGTFLISTVFGLLVVIEMACGLTCYQGSSGAVTTSSGCTYCQKLTTSGVSTATCASTCSAGTVSYGGYSVTTTCCTSDYCNSIGGSGSSGGLSCYYGSQGSLVSQSGCTSCQKLVYTSSGVTSYSSSCLTTSCTPASGTLLGVTTTTYCCSTNNCNDDAFGTGSGASSGGSGGLLCYEGSAGSLVSKSGCTSCQKVVATGYGISSAYSSCLTTTCSPSSYDYSGYTSATYCCSTNNCNGDAFSGTSGVTTGGLRCYEGSAGSLVSKSGCTSCQKTSTSGGMAMSTSSCLTTACTPASYSYGGYSATITCCSTDNCNGASKSRAVLAPLAVFMAANALWALIHN